MKLPKRFSRRARKVFFFVHLWTGLIVGLWFAMMGVTGSVLAWLPELLSTELKMRYPQDNPGGGAAYIPLSRAVAAMKAAQPDMTPKELAGVMVPNSRYPYYVFVRKEKPFKNAQFLVDPYSARVNAPRVGIDSYMFRIAHFHGELLLEAKGLIANGIGSALGVLMLLSGLWLWWPSTVGQLRTRLSIKRGVSLRRRLIDLHNVMGIYFYSIVFITTLTAVVLAYNDVTDDGFQRALDGVRISTKPGPVRVVPPTKASSKLSDDELVERAKAAAPGATLVRVKRSLQPTAPFEASLEYERGLYPHVNLVLDPYNGQILKTQADTTASRGHKAMSVTEELHYGTFGGIGTKLAYTFAGLMPVGLFITGIWMWWKRKRAQTALQQRRAAQSPRPANEAVL